MPPTDSPEEPEKQWSSELVDSSKFREPEGHVNPSAMPFRRNEFEAKEVRVRAFRLPPDLVSKITPPSESLRVKLSDVPDDLAEYLRADGGGDENASGFYWSSQPGSSEPVVGDMKIRFTATYRTDVSVMAQQVGDTFDPFKTHSGRELSMLTLGTHSADAMISDAESTNAALTWGLRILGMALMFGGVALVLQPLHAMTEWIPVVGRLVGLGTAIVALLVGGAAALLTISFAWVFYRPLVGVPLLIAGIGLLILLARRLREQPTTSQTPPPLPT